jgi:hypothetical protein
MYSKTICTIARTQLNRVPLVAAATSKSPQNLAVKNVLNQTLTHSPIYENSKNQPPCYCHPTFQKHPGQLIGTDWFGAQTKAGSRKSGPSDTANLSFSTHAAKGSFLSLFCIRGCNPRPPYSRYQTQAGAWSMHTYNLAEYPQTTKHANSDP